MKAKSLLHAMLAACGLLGAAFAMPATVQALPWSGASAVEQQAVQPETVQYYRDGYRPHWGYRPYRRPYWHSPYWHRPYPRPYWRPYGPPPYRPHWRHRYDRW